jgi:K+-sensing histidine kinase KdpD
VTGGGSTGLGLAVVQRLVAAQGGRIDATSEPGEGARFVVSFASAQTAWADDGADDPGDGIDADHADGSGSARTG